MVSTYRTRDDVARRLGFVSYTSYLNSKLWAAIRQRAFRVHGHECKICGSHTNILHHKNYEWEVMIGKTVRGLIPLCRSCHYRIEFEPNGCKRTLDRANNLLAWAMKEGEDKLHKMKYTKRTPLTTQKIESLEKLKQIQQHNEQAQVEARKNMTPNRQAGARPLSKFLA